MEGGARPSFVVPSPTTFTSDAASRPGSTLIIASTFDVLALQNPLRVWLSSLIGLSITPKWIGYGVALDAICNSQSAWNSNHAGVNVLLFREVDLLRHRGRDDAAAAAHRLVEGLQQSCYRRHGTTVLLLPPSGTIVQEDNPGAQSRRTLGGSTACSKTNDLSLTSRLKLIDGICVYDEHLLLRKLGSLRYHSPFLDRVAHAPFSPAACSVFASVIARELVRSIAVTRKVYCLDCDNTLWGGAVGEVGVHGIRLDDDFLQLQQRFVHLQERGALLCLITRNEEADVRAVLRERRDEMILHEEHVVAIRAGWGAKSASVLEVTAFASRAWPSTFMK